MENEIAPFEIPLEKFMFTFIDQNKYSKQFKKRAIREFSEEETFKQAEEHKNIIIQGTHKSVLIYNKNTKTNDVHHNIDIMYDFNNKSQGLFYQLLALTIHETCHGIDDEFSKNTKEQGLELLHLASNNSEKYKLYKEFNKLPKSITSHFINQPLVDEELEIIITGIEAYHFTDYFQSDYLQGVNDKKRMKELERARKIKEQIYNASLIESKEIDSTDMYEGLKRLEGWAEFFTEHTLLELTKSKNLQKLINQEDQKKYIKSFNKYLSLNPSYYLDGYTMFKELGIDGALKKLNLVSGASCPYIPKND